MKALIGIVIIIIAIGFYIGFRALREILKEDKYFQYLENKKKEENEGN